MRKKQSEEDKKKALNIVLGIALLFFAVILAVNGVRKLQTDSVFSAIIALSGMALFGGVGVMLLVGELRQWKSKKKSR